MASLSSILLDADRIKGGAWVPIKTRSGDTFEIRTRGIGDAYRDALAVLQRDALRKMNEGAPPGRQVTTETMPPSASSRCVATALIQHCLLDVRDLHHGDGRPVTLAEFTALMLDPDHGQNLTNMVAEAAGFVTLTRNDEIKEAVGNSPAA